MRNTVVDDIKLKAADKQDIRSKQNKNIYKLRKNLGHFKSSAEKYKTQTE